MDSSSRASPALSAPMTSAAMIRSAVRSLRLRLRQPLEQERSLLSRRFLSSSSVPTERHTCSPTSSRPLKGSMEQKGHVHDKTGDVYKQLMMKIDMVSAGFDEHSRLLKQLAAEIEENNKIRGTIDLTPWVVSISSSLLLFGLYNYVY